MKNELVPPSDTAALPQGTEYRKQWAGELPGWEVVPTAQPRIAHPADGDRGVLVRHSQTGRYSLALGGSLRSVPPRWATQQDLATPAPRSSIRPSAPSPLAKETP